jgi:hypothetical protein
MDIISIEMQNSARAFALFIRRAAEHAAQQECGGTANYNRAVTQHLLSLENLWRDRANTWSGMTEALVSASDVLMDLAPSECEMFWKAVALGEISPETASFVLSAMLFIGA